MAQQRTHSVPHPTMGFLKGLSNEDDGVLQFKGIQYATLASRFAPAQLKYYDGAATTTLDATSIGPQVLSIAPGPEAEFGLIQHDLPYDKSSLSMSDTEGLCLNITIPSNTPPDAKLPVFVFIHGGGYMVGSAMWPQYDMRRFVALSVEAGTPVIAVVMNYRLGAPGLLYSTSDAWKEAGLLANNCLRDQRMALRWVQRYIAGFGGNPAEVTVAGESVGGVSVCYHLFAEETLFSRILPMSGTHLLLPPTTPEAAEAEFSKACTALGAEGGSEVQALSRMDSNQMVGKLMAAGLRLSPVVDGDIVPTAFDFAALQAGQVAMPGLAWCKGAMIGDCAFDGSIRMLDLGSRKEGIGAAFCSSIESSFPSAPDVARKWLQAYALSPSTPDDEAFEKVLQVANDLNFYAPTLVLASYLRTHQPHLRGAVYGYRFNTPNPWPGAWQGRATHILDISFLFQNFDEYLDERDREVARRFGRDVVTFVNGEVPWRASVARGGGREENLARVYGAGGKVEDVGDVPNETGRRAIMVELAESLGWDKLNEVFATFCKPVEKPAPSM